MADRPPASETAIIAAWNSGLSREKAAEALGMSPYSLDYHWRRLRRSGMIIARYKYQEARDLDPNPHTEDGKDARPTVGDDPLLEQLIKHHGRKTC